MIIIDIFATGNGESILIQLPNNKYGVVDCYSDRLESIEGNLLCKYLDKQGVRELLFVCWTHPHSDHSRGLPLLLRRFSKNIEYFWRFGAESIHELCAHIKTYARKYEGTNNPVTRELIGREHYLIDIFHQIKKNFKRDNIRLINSGTLLWEDPEHGLKITGLSPFDSIKVKYDRKIHNIFINADKSELSRRNLHNNISAAILIEYGKAKIILGADTENNNWAKLFKDKSRKFAKFPLHFIKVPHHGSEGAFYERYWKIWSPRKSLFSVITPFQNRNLPKDKMVRRFNRLSHCMVLGKKANLPKSIIDILLRIATKEGKTHEKVDMTKFSIRENCLNFLRFLDINESLNIHRIKIAISSTGEVTLKEFCKYE